MTFLLTSLRRKAETLLLLRKLIESRTLDLTCLSPFHAQTTALMLSNSTGGISAFSSSGRINIFAIPSATLANVRHQTQRDPCDAWMISS